MKAGTFVIAALAGLSATSVGAQPDPRAPQVLTAVQAQLGGAFAEDATFAIAFSDLNDDHHPEAIVHLAGRDLCGSGGCTTYVMAQTESGWAPIGRMSVSRLPIYRLPEHREGWFDLAVYVGGGGTQPGLRTVRFAKGRYSSNPSKGPAVGRLPQQATLVMPATSEMAPVR